MKRQGLKIKEWLPVAAVMFFAALFGVLTASGRLDLGRIPELANGNPQIAVLIIMGLFAAKGVSGVILYNALIVGVSLVFPLREALIINSAGTAITLSISYILGSLSGSGGLERLLSKHEKIRRFFGVTRRYGFAFCLAVHLLGLNMEVLGLAFGMLKIGFVRYLVSSWIAVVPGMFCFTVMGSTFDLRSPAFWIVLAIDLVLIAGAFFYTRKKTLESESEELRAGEDTVVKL